MHALLLQALVLKDLQMGDHQPAALQDYRPRRWAHMWPLSKAAVLTAAMQVHAPHCAEPCRA